MYTRLKFSSYWVLFLPILIMLSCEEEDPTFVSWNCLSGNCIEVEEEVEYYSSREICEFACSSSTNGNGNNNNGGSQGGGNDNGGGSNGCPATVVDADGNVYQVLQLGSQCWMAKDLITEKYNDGTSIQRNLDNAEWASATSGAFAKSTKYDRSWARIYNGHAMISGKLCPKGWKVPDYFDWEELFDFVGHSNNAGRFLKSTTLWSTPNDADNSSGFGARPNLRRYPDGSFPESSIFGGKWGDIGTWWCARTGYNYDDRALSYTRFNYKDGKASTGPQGFLDVGQSYLNFGTACRCIMK